MSSWLSGGRRPPVLVRSHSFPLRHGTRPLLTLPPCPVGTQSQVESSDDDLLRGDAASSDFRRMMDFVFALRLCALSRGEGVTDRCCSLHPTWPVQLPGYGEAPRFTRAQPMQFSLDSASSALLRAVDSSRPSLARFPKCKFFSSYSVVTRNWVGLLQ